MNPSGGSDYDRTQSNTISPASQQGVTFDALNAREVQTTGSLDADLSASQAIINAEERQAEQQLLASQSVGSRARIIKFVMIGILLLLGLAFVILRHNESTANLNSEQTDVSQRFAVTSIPLADINTNSPALSVQNSQTLSVNGQLNVNNTLVLAPTTQPSGAVTGQLYYDQTSNRLSYYNGSSFVDLLSGNQIVSSVGGASGSLTTGNGLAVNGNTLRNTGVLTLQGQSGDVSLVAGSGIAVSGTTLSNSGLLSLGGQNGNILLGTGLSLSGNTLNAQSGIQSLSSATNNVTVMNTGNGNWSIGVSVSGGAGSGTVASSGGTVGQLAYFAGVQDIENSLVSQSGSTVTVGGNLSVTGSLTLSTPLSVANGGTGATSPTGARTGIGAAASGANSDITSLSGLTTALSVSQGGIGLSALTANEILFASNTSSVSQLASGTAGLCLTSNGSLSAPSFQTCAGAGGVTSVDGLSGNITLANSSGSGGTITISNAAADGSTKGIAAFNGTNFSASSGVINTIQNINTGASPSFAGLSLGSALTVGNGGTASTTAAGARTNLGAAASGANSDITSLSGLTTALSVSQGGIGLTSLTANELLLASSTSSIGQLSNGLSGQCLVSNGASAPSFQTCTGAGGVSSLNSLTGSISIANATGTGSTITISNAAADGSTKGIAAFNGTNFSASSGVINTIQDINSTATPTFASITISNTINANTITPSSAMTIGSTGQSFTLQGNATSTVTATGGGFTTTVGFNGTPTNNVTYQFDRSAVGGTYTICTSIGNCAGSGGGITGSGTTNRIAVFSGSGTIASSDITDVSATSVSIASGVNLAVQGSASFENATNSTTAFQIQNSSSAALFTADTTNQRIGVDVTYALMSTPTTLAVGTATAGGSLAASTTYYYKVTAIDATGGETTASSEANGATTGVNKTLPVTWNSVSGASGYNVYRATTSGTEVYLTTVLTNSFTDSGTFSAGTATPPTTTTAYVSTNVSNNQLQVSIGGLGKPTGQLYVSGSIPTTATGTIATGTSPTVIKIVGNYAYVTDFLGNSLQIFNISNASDPITVSTTSTGTSSNPAGIDVKGNYAYIAYNSNSNVTGNKLAIYNIANPSSPTAVGSVATDASPSRVTVQGKYAYVTTGNNTLQIFDISNPASPVRVSTTTTGASSGPLNVFVLGNYAYVTDNGSNDLQIFDISNPASPVSLSTTALGGTAYGVYVQGDYAYVTVFGTNLLKIFDISNPASPTQVGSMAPGSSPANVYVQGHYAYVVNKGGNSFTTIDVSDPYNPTSLGATTTGTSPLDLVVKGSYIYVIANAGNSLQDFNVGGAYVQQLQTGGIDTGTLSTTGSANIAGNTNIQGGITVGAAANFGASIGVNGSATIGGSVSIAGGITGGVVINSLSAPSAPTVTNIGTAGSTSYSYTVAAVSASGGITPASSTGSTATSNATLNGTNYNQITWTPVSGATSYKLYRTVGGATQGLLTTTNTTLYNDIGSAASGSSQTIDTTGQLQLGASAGSGFFLDNGSTQYGVDSSQSFSANGTITNLNTYSVLLITATNSGLTLTLPNPSPATAGKLLYISNNSSGSNLFTLAPTSGVSMPLNTGASTTLLWNGSTWTYSGTDASSILNQNSATQTGNFKISGTGTAAALQASTLDTAAAGTLTIGGTNATTIQIGKTSTATSQTIDIGNNATSGSSDAVVIGSLTSGSTTLIQGGTGGNGLDLETNGGFLNIGTNSSAQFIDIGTGSSTGFIGIGNGSTPGVDIESGGAGIQLQTTSNIEGTEVQSYNSSNSTDAFYVADYAGKSVINVDTVNNQLDIGQISTTATHIGGSILIADGTIDGFGTTISTATLTGNQTITLPNATGTVCLTSQNCSTAGTGYILNQATSPGSAQTGNFNITGTGIASALQASSFDTAAAATLSIGTTNATTIQIGKTNTAVAQTINLGTNSTAGSTSTVTIGSTVSTGTTKLQAGATSQSLSNTGDILQTTTNETSAFQVQNSTSAAVLNVSTTQDRVTVNGGDLSVTGVANPGAPALSTTTGGSLTSGTYYYELAALASDGTSTMAIASSPASIPTAASGKNNLSWTNVANNNGYLLYQSTNGSTWLVRTLAANAVSYSDTSSTGWLTCGSSNPVCPENTNFAGGIYLQDATPIVFDAGTGGQGAMAYYNAVQNYLVLGNYNTGGGFYQEGNSYDFRDTSTFHNDFVINSTGQATFSDSTDGASAFQVQNAVGSTLLNVDTSGNAVGIGATGSLALTSTVNIATSSSSSSTQTVNIGSTANTSDSTTIQGSTSSVTIGNTGFNFQASNQSANNTYLFQGNGTIAASGSVGTFFANTTSAQTALDAVSTFGQSSGTNTLLVQSKNGGAFTELFGVGATGNVNATTLSGSTSAFVIQDSSSGTTLFNADTTNNQVTLSSAKPSLILNMTGTTDENGILFENSGSNTGEIGISGGAGQIINQTAAGDLALKSAAGSIYLAANGSAADETISSTDGDTTFQNSTNNTNAFVIQNATSVVLFNVNTSTSTITVSGSPSSFGTLNLANAHFESQQNTAPTIGVATCSGTPTVTASSTDSAGSFSMPVTTTGGACVITLTFNQAYGSAPKSVVLAPKSANYHVVEPYVSSTSTSTFVVTFGVGASTSTTYQFYYWVVE